MSGACSEAGSALIDVGEYLHKRREALLAHRTQVDPTGFWMRLPDDVIRQAVHLVGRADRKLRVCAVRLSLCGAAEVNAGTGRESVNAVTNLIDDAGCVGAGCVRQSGGDRIPAGAHVSVVRIDADGVNPDAHLPGPGDGIRNLFEP